jgi:opacity protein-like surface antigen
MMRSFVCALGAITLLAVPAAAQEGRVMVSVSGGGALAKTQDFRQAAEFPLYDETGTWDAAHTIEGGSFFDIGGGVRVTRNFGVGIAYTVRSKHTRDVTVNASVPSPIFFDTFRSATATVPGLEHTERAVHLQAQWHVPVTVEFGLTLSAGPTFFSVRDELIESLAPGETGGNAVRLENIGISGQRNTTTGFHVGLDAQYMFMRNIGAGAMLRYSRGSVDLTAPAGTSSGQIAIDTGGLEIGAGLRFRF